MFLSLLQIQNVDSPRISLLVPLPMLADIITKLEVSGVRIFLLITGVLGLAYSVEILRSNASKAGGSFFTSAFIFLFLMAFMRSGTFAISIFLGFVISFVLATILLSLRSSMYAKFVNLVFLCFLILLAIFRSELSQSLSELLLASIFLLWYYAFVFQFERWAK